MKKNYLLTILSLIFCLAFHYTNAQFVFTDDNATNSYTSPLSNGDTGGSGFFPWDINAGTGTGAFIGDPANDGMGTTNIGTTAWGFYANGNAYINAQRYFDNIGMEIGDEFTFDWAMNFDAGGGAKGFDFKKDGGGTVFNINNGSSAVIDGENGTIDSNYGTTPMSVTLKRISSSDYSFSMTSRSGGATYTATFSSGETVKGINIYSGNQNNGAGERNIYFNNFLLQNSGSFDISGGSETYTKDLTGSTAVSKSGVGTLTLSGNNTYTGTTTVSAGTLVLESNLAGSAITVNSGATLQISEDATISSLTVDAGGIVIVDAGKGLNITGNLTNNGTITANSGSSLMVGGTSTGNITYNVAVNDTNWHLISSPVVGEQYDDTWVTNNSIASGVINTDNRGIATYQNGTPDGTTGPWTYFQTGGTAATFGAGVGYSLKRTGDGNYTFTGTFPTTDVTPAISQDVNNWNLIGNPYPSYLNIADFITANSVTNDNLSAGFLAVYVWNAGSGAYDNLTTGHIHPGQAFFVNSKVNGTASITDAMQSHQTGITFYKNADTSIELSLSNGTNSKRTKVNYLDGKTTSLDPGFDIGMFDGVSSDLSLYTNLVNDNEGIAFARQALPNSDLESMVIPVGIIADAGEITFSAETVNFPSELKVFLEDRLENTFIRLDETNSSYAVTLTEKSDGIGRFYLHTNSSALSTDNVQLENISIYKANASTLRIVGLSQGKANVKLFNILGEQVLNRNFTSNGVYDVNLPQLATGVYIAQLENQNGKINKKIVLE